MTILEDVERLRRLAELGDQRAQGVLLRMERRAGIVSLEVALEIPSRLLAVVATVQLGEGRAWEIHARLMQAIQATERHPELLRRWGELAGTRVRLVQAVKQGLIDRERVRDDPPVVAFHPWHLRTCSFDFETARWYREKTGHWSEGS